MFGNQIDKGGCRYYLEGVLCLLGGMDYIKRLCSFLELIRVSRNLFLREDVDEFFKIN